MNFKKIILITGVSSGIGESFVKKITQMHVDYMIVGLGRNNINEFEAKNFIFIKVDMENVEEIKNAVDTILNEFGRVDVIINNAGFAYKSTIEDMNFDEMDKQFRVNVYAPITLIRMLLPSMRENKAGHIINVSSIATVVSTPTLGYYAATKSVLDKLSEVLREEVKKWNIKVSIFSPGSVKSNFGKNIKEVNNFSSSVYKDTYESWERRFRYFFKDRVTQEEAAIELITMLDNPKSNYFFQFRDKKILFAKRFLPLKLFNKLILNYFYKDETK